MDNEPVLGEIYVRGKMHDGKYDDGEKDVDEKKRKFFSIRGFLSDKYRKVFVKRLYSEKHTLKKSLNGKTVISNYVHVNGETIGGILERTYAKYLRMKEIYENTKEKYNTRGRKKFEEHLNIMENRLDLLERIKSEEREIIELIGGGAIEDLKYSDLIIREIGSFLVMPSYRVMEFGTKGFIELTETAYWLNGIPTDIMTFRTANPWLIRMKPHLQDAGYNYVLAGESPRKDGKGKVVQYMLFLQMKDVFDERLFYAEKRYPIAHDVLETFSDTVIDFMENGVEKVSLRQLKDQDTLLEAFPAPEQFESGKKSDYDYVRQYIEQMEDKYTYGHKVSYWAASIALNNKERYAFLPELFKKLISTLDSYNCHDLEEFEMRNGLPIQPKEEVYKALGMA